MDKVLVCGGRDFNYPHVVQGLIECAFYDEIWAQPSSCPWKMYTLICGMAKGVDLIAYNWAKGAGMPVEEYPALWDVHGRSAGFIRNKLMLEDGKPDYVIAFPGGKGTAMMVRLAKEAGVEVIDYG